MGYASSRRQNTHCCLTFPLPPQLVRHNSRICHPRLVSQTEHRHTPATVQAPRLCPVNIPPKGQKHLKTAPTPTLPNMSPTHGGSPTPRVPPCLRTQTKMHHQLGSQKTAPYPHIRIVWLARASTTTESPHVPYHGQTTHLSLCRSNCPCTH